jgi:hypothetical protein
MGGKNVFYLYTEIKRISTFVRVVQSANRNYIKKPGASQLQRLSIVHAGLEFQVVTSVHFRSLMERACQRCCFVVYSGRPPESVILPNFHVVYQCH